MGTGGGRVRSVPVVPFGEGLAQAVRADQLHLHPMRFPLAERRLEEQGGGERVMEGDLRGRPGTRPRRRRRRARAGRPPGRSVGGIPRRPVRHCCVTSMPTAAKCGTGAAKTLAAAWGSQRMFHSGWGRWKYQPPIMVRPLSSDGISGSRANSRAMLVSGPMASSVTSPGRARIVSRRKLMAVLSASNVRCGHWPDANASACGAWGCCWGTSSGAATADVDGHVVAPPGAADGVGQRRPLFRLAADGRDAQQFAARLAEQIGQRQGVVNVRADVGVQQDGEGVGHGSVSSRG